jgi:hypothetical protein
LANFETKTTPGFNKLPDSLRFRDSQAADIEMQRISGSGHQLFLESLFYFLPEPQSGSAGGAWRNGMARRWRNRRKGSARQYQQNAMVFFR